MAPNVHYQTRDNTNESQDASLTRKRTANFDRLVHASKAPRVGSPGSFMKPLKDRESSSALALVEQAQARAKALKRTRNQGPSRRQREDPSRDLRLRAAHNAASTGGTIETESTPNTAPNNKPSSTPPSTLSSPSSSQSTSNNALNSTRQISAAAQQTTQNDDPSSTAPPTSSNKTAQPAQQSTQNDDPSSTAPSTSSNKTAQPVQQSSQNDDPSSTAPSTSSNKTSSSTPPTQPRSPSSPDYVKQITHFFCFLNDPHGLRIVRDFLRRLPEDKLARVLRTAKATPKTQLSELYQSLYEKAVNSAPRWDERENERVEAMQLEIEAQVRREEDERRYEERERELRLAGEKLPMMRNKTQHLRSASESVSKEAGFDPEEDWGSKDETQFPLNSPRQSQSFRTSCPPSHHSSFQDQNQPFRTPSNPSSSQRTSGQSSQNQSFRTSCPPSHHSSSQDQTQPFRRPSNPSSSQRTSGQSSQSSSTSAPQHRQSNSSSSQQKLEVDLQIDKEGKPVLLEEYPVHSYRAGLLSRFRTSGHRHGADMRGHPRKKRGRANVSGANVSDSETNEEEDYPPVTRKTASGRKTRSVALTIPQPALRSLEAIYPAILETVLFHYGPFLYHSSETIRPHFLRLWKGTWDWKKMPPSTPHMSKRVLHDIRKKLGDIVKNWVGIASNVIPQVYKDVVPRDSENRPQWNVLARQGLFAVASSIRNDHSTVPQLNLFSEPQLLELIVKTLWQRNQVCVRLRFDRRKFIEQINDNFICTVLMVFDCAFKRLVHRGTHFQITAQQYKDRWTWYAEWWAHNEYRDQVISYLKQRMYSMLDRVFQNDDLDQEVEDSQAEDRDPLPSDFLASELQTQRSGNVIEALSSMGPRPSSPVLPSTRPMPSSPPSRSFAPDDIDIESENSQRSFTRSLTRGVNGGMLGDVDDRLPTTGNQDLDSQPLGGGPGAPDSQLHDSQLPDSQPQDPYLYRMDDNLDDIFSDMNETRGGGVVEPGSRAESSLEIPESFDPTLGGGG